MSLSTPPQSWTCRRQWSSLECTRSRQRQLGAWPPPPVPPTASWPEGRPSAGTACGRGRPGRERAERRSLSPCLALVLWAPPGRSGGSCCSTEKSKSACASLATARPSLTQLSLIRAALRPPAYSLACVAEPHSYWCCSPACAALRSYCAALLLHRHCRRRYCLPAPS